MALNFPENAQDGDIYEGFEYVQSSDSWKKVRPEYATKTYVDNNLATKLDFTLLGQSLGIPQLTANTQIDPVNLADIIDNAPEGLNSLGKLALMFTVKTPAEWDATSSSLAAGSINVELNTSTNESKIKVGVGNKTWADLEYVADEAFVNQLVADAQIDHANFATKESPTFTGYVYLPSTTDIGDVTSSEIARLSGLQDNIVTLLSSKLSTADADLYYAKLDSPDFIGTVTLPSATSIGTVASDEISTLSGSLTNTTIQTQINNILLDKADKDSPIFTGTVSGIDKTMVGLENVDNTSDQDKPISDATQAALDLKASLSGAIFSGDIDVQNITIAGDLTVGGTATIVDTKNYTTRDNMVYMNQAGEFSITNAVGDGTSVVYTAPDHDYSVGDYIVVTGIDPTTYNIAGSANLTISAVSGDTFTVTKSDTGTYVSGGLARGKSAANPDLGIAAGYNDGTYHHTGFFRDATDGRWKVFEGYTPEPDTSPYIDTSHVSFALADMQADAVFVNNVTFSDASVQTKAGVPSLTSFVYKTASYTLDSLTLRDNMIEVDTTSASAVITIPPDSTINYPVGTSIDILQTGTGALTVSPGAGVTLNGTPGFKLRTKWSSATILKRAANTWIVFGDLTV